MTTTLNFDLKDIMHILCQEHRWDVLTVYILFGNKRGRTYPSAERVARTACNGNTNKASSAKKWLVDHGALTLVPHSLRVEDEPKAPARHVWQLTGLITWEGREYKYLYYQVPPEAETEAQPITAKKKKEPKHAPEEQQRRRDLFDVLKNYWGFQEPIDRANRSMLNTYVFKIAGNYPTLPAYGDHSLEQMFDDYMNEQRQYLKPGQNDTDIIQLRQLQTMIFKLKKMLDYGGNGVVQWENLDHEVDPGCLACGGSGYYQGDTCWCFVPALATVIEACHGDVERASRERQAYLQARQAGER